MWRHRAHRSDGGSRIARLDPAGALSSLAVIAMVAGARNAVVDSDGNAYLTDSAGGTIQRIAAVSPAK